MPLIFIHGVNTRDADPDWTRKQMAEPLGFLADAHVVAAEPSARLAKHQEALQHLLKLRIGHLPVFTDGFSIWKAPTERSCPTRN
jgi:hypothetical protein